MRNKTPKKERIKEIWVLGYPTVKQTNFFKNGELIAFKQRPKTKRYFTTAVKAKVILPIQHTKYAKKNY